MTCRKHLPSSLFRQATKGQQQQRNKPLSFSRAAGACLSVFPAPLLQDTATSRGWQPGPWCKAGPAPTTPEHPTAGPCPHHRSTGPVPTRPAPRTHPVPAPRSVASPRGPATRTGRRGDTKPRSSPSSWEQDGAPAQPPPAAGQDGAPGSAQTSPPEQGGCGRRPRPSSAAAGGGWGRGRGPVRPGLARLSTARHGPSPAGPCRDSRGGGGERRPGAA